MRPGSGFKTSQSGGLTRRAFVKTGATFGLVTVASCVVPWDLPLPDPVGGVTVFKRSGRGLRVSNAAQKHNANRLYFTEQAALGDAPHPGDNSRVVPVDISAALAATLFPGNKVIADLRRDL